MTIAARVAEYVGKSHRRANRNDELLIRESGEELADHAREIPRHQADENSCREQDEPNVPSPHDQYDRPTHDDQRHESFVSHSHPFESATRNYLADESNRAGSGVKCGSPARRGRQSSVFREPALCLPHPLEVQGILERMFVLGDRVMPNDAKLGLLAGVIGVIAAAVLSANQPAPQGSSGSVSTSAHKVAPHKSVVTEPIEQPSTTIPLTRPEP